MSESKIIKNTSKAYNYNYAGLSDLAEQGVEIPKMKTGNIGGSEYVFYWDGTEWQQGAKVVIPTSKGMNEAQAYGSALTYARRYTTQLAKSVACRDDDKIENIQSPSPRVIKEQHGDTTSYQVAGAKGYAASANKPASERQIEAVRTLCGRAGKTLQEMNAIVNAIKTSAQASAAIKKLGEEVAKRGEQ